MRFRKALPRRRERQRPRWLWVAYYDAEEDLGVPVGAVQKNEVSLTPNPEELTTTERLGRREVEQPEVGPGGARRAGASESKDSRAHRG